MTPEQKQAITALRASGCGYKTIASRLSLSLNTVKSFCRRQGVNPSSISDEEKEFCPVCAKRLNHRAGKKKKKYCSDACRMAWWNAHQDKVKRQTFSEFTCLSCQKSFQVYGSRKRKYCSHSCYIVARFGGGCDDNERT